MRDLAQQALERGEVDLYEGYMRAAEDVAHEEIYGEARRKSDEIATNRLIADAAAGGPVPAPETPGGLSVFDEEQVLDILDGLGAQGVAEEPPADLPVEYLLDPSRYTGDAPVSQRGLFERGMVNQGMLEAYPGVNRFEYAGPGLDYLPRNFQRAKELDSNLSLPELREILRKLGI